MSTYRIEHISNLSKYIIHISFSTCYTPTIFF
nr:MAG TPA: hypothetical protein [Bacteriophage sp.]